MADSNKTEGATPRRRQKAREQGQVARSRELPSLMAAATVVGGLMIIVPTAITRWSVLYSTLLDIAATGTIDRNGPVLFLPSVELLRWIVPLLLAAMVASVCTGLIQGGFNMAPQALGLKFERFNPVSKLGQIFSAGGLSNLLKSLLPFGAMAWIAVSILESRWTNIVGASNLELRTLANFVGAMIFELVWKSGLVLSIWSAVDYALTWRKMESDLKMTKEEVREERKETDGNPQIKGRIRQMRRRVRKAQLLKAAATATVVITNPTHFAVALRYESDMDAPVVVAKGLDLLAEKIKELARKNGIMLVENRPLAQSLYKAVDVGETIPAKLYEAVAEILVLVYKAQAKVRREEAERRSRDASGRKVTADPSGAAAVQR
jgi:flagellar biosynthetic protein FlhB